MLKASDFGLPQRRERLFILAVNAKRASEELLAGASEVLDRAVKSYLALSSSGSLAVTSYSLAVTVTDFMHS